MLYKQKLKVSLSITSYNSFSNNNNNDSCCTTGLLYSYYYTNDK